MSKTEIKISAAFTAQASKAITSIILFLQTYFLMVALAIGLTALCIYGGIMLIAIRPSIVTLALGIGLGSLGIMVLIFLLKFLFKSHKVDRSHLTEIKRVDEPQLFALIDSIVQKVGTRFPKRVYLSTEVNASVFYDSEFWSMFFPVKKNLQIGLGLINAVSKSELTAILSHEFGHFSQRTMKVGSYVYNVNKVISNMLYDNESYDKMIQRWANATGYFTLFVVIAAKIVQGIQWVLALMYRVVNKSYMGLSREMEFHADQIAASVTGFEPLRDSLLRLPLADHSLQSAISFYESKIPENQKSENIFKDQFFVMTLLAQNDGLKIKNGLPEVAEAQANKFNKSKLVIKDQWASHPDTEDRIKMLEKTGLSSQNADNAPANLLFSNMERTQEKLTGRLFQQVDYPGLPSVLSSETFQTEFKDSFLKNSFPEVYNNYYDDKNPCLFDSKEVGNLTENLALSDLFSEEKVDWIYTTIALQNDIETLKQIAGHSIQIKTFDYDGIRYAQKDSKNLVPKLEKELEELNEQIKQNDLRIFQFFKACEDPGENGSRLEELYRQFFDYENEFDTKYGLYDKLSQDLNFVHVTTPFEQIKAKFLEVEETEIKLKEAIREILNGQIYQTEITQEMRDNFESYLSRKWTYFVTDHYLDDNLNILFTAMNNYASLLSSGYFLHKLELLNYQAGLVDTEKQKVEHV